MIHRALPFFFIAAVLFLPTVGFAQGSTNVRCLEKANEDPSARQIMDDSPPECIPNTREGECFYSIGRGSDYCDGENADTMTCCIRWEESLCFRQVSAAPEGATAVGCLPRTQCNPSGDEEANLQQRDVTGKVLCPTSGDVCCSAKTSISGMVPLSGGGASSPGGGGAASACATAARNGGFADGGCTAASECLPPTFEPIGQVPFVDQLCPEGQVCCARQGSGAPGGTAQPAQSVTLPDPLGGVTVPRFFGNVIRVFMSIAGAIALLMFVYGGIMWILSGGEAAKVKAAQKILVNSTIGLILIFGAYLFTSSILSAVLGTSAIPTP